MAFWNIPIPNATMQRHLRYSDYLRTLQILQKPSITDIQTQDIGNSIQWLLHLQQPTSCPSRKQSTIPDTQESI